MWLNGNRSFSGSITPPNTATATGSSHGSLASARSSCLREPATAPSSSVSGPIANTASGSAASSSRWRDEEAARVAVPAAYVQRAAEDDAGVAAERADLGRVSQLGSVAEHLEPIGHGSGDFFGGLVLRRISDQQWLRHGDHLSESR